MLSRATTTKNPSASPFFLSSGSKPGQDKTAAKSCRSLYLTDHLGSTRTAVDASGTVQETFDYYPFGLLMPKRGTTSDNTMEKFTGHEYDEHSGLELYYAGARYLDAAIGQFTSVDPLADQFPAWSPYNYGMNNPNRFIDPTGMASREIMSFGNANYGNYTSLEEKREAREEEKKQANACPNPPCEGDNTNENSKDDKEEEEIDVSYGYPGQSLGIIDFIVGPGKFKPGAKAGGRLLEWLFALVKTGKRSSSVLKFSTRQLQRKFKHAHYFGIAGNYNKVNAAKFSSAINKHINASGVKKIKGTLHGKPVIHYLNPKTGLNVVSSRSGTFITGYKISSKQIKHVLKHGGI